MRNSPYPGCPRRLAGGARLLGAVLAAWVAIAAGAPVAAAFPSHAGGDGLFDVRSAEVPVAGSLSIALTGVGYRIPVDRAPFDLYDRTLLDGGLSVSWGLRDVAELYFRANGAAWSYGDTDVFSYRDGLAGAKFALPGRLTWLATGVDVNFGIPWGARDRGFSTGSWDPSVTALFTVPLPESNTLTSAALHFNVGYRSYGDDRGRTFEGFPWYYLEPAYPEGDNDRVDLRAAIELGSEELTLFTELVLDRILNDNLAWHEAPIFLTPGLRYSLGDSWSVTLASKVTIATDAEGTDRYRAPEDLYPQWQLGFALTWSRFGPEVDRDGDGVPDWKDRCPRVPEDVDGWQDDDGCPDPDNDRDGVPDEFDGAPNVPEDFDGYLDSDGVPDPDNDGDEIPDVEDECPERAEDFDGIADEDGCPEDDADGDGVLDVDDVCPEEAETVDGVDDEDGCPDRVGVVDPYLLRGVLWEGVEVAPRSVSYFELNALAESMRADPRVVIEVKVHAGADSGGDALAQQRADYLKGFLVAAGVSPVRVIATSSAGDSIFASPFEIPAQLAGRTMAEIIPQTRGTLADQ